jgi:hypothetical protein
MKVHSAASLVFCVFSVASCGGHQPVELDAKNQPLTPRWNATLVTPASLAGALQIRGTGWMAANDKNGDQTVAQAEIANAAPGGLHPWHVHRGQCGSDQGILGPADAYKPLKVNGDGRATATATLDIPVPKTGDYFVNVHASSANMGTIVACGNLAPPSR